mgnify:CR=1 FL=1
MRSDENFEPEDLEEHPVTAFEMKSILNKRDSDGIFSHPSYYGSGNSSIITKSKVIREAYLSKDGIVPADQKANFNDIINSMITEE